MNYFPFHISDWALHTSHLTLEEEAVYLRLLHYYYDTEQPIPKETQSVIRRLRINQNTDLFSSVLKEFFTLEDDGWHNRRADKEIAIYSAKADIARENGKKGGRPRKIKGLANNQAGFDPVPTENQAATNGKANQEPRTKNQEPLSTQANACSGNPSGCPPCPIEEIISIYHETLPTLPKQRVRTAARDEQIRARWKQFFSEGDFKDKESGLDCFRWFFTEKVKASRCLMGQTQTNGRKPFVADLEWVTKQANFAKIIEGRYSNGA